MCHTLEWKRNGLSVFLIDREVSMERISGVACTFDKDDSVIDMVIERTENYYKIHGKLPTVAYVPKGTSQQQIDAIIDLGNITSVIPQYGFNLVLIGMPIEHSEEEKRRIENLLDDSKEEKEVTPDDSKEQETGQRLGE